MSALPVNSNIPSPSLASNAAGARQAYELKFLVSDQIAAKVLDWSRAGPGMKPDPHGDPQLGGAYQTTTLYLDTPHLDVYHRTPAMENRKHRLRRYGLATWVSLECKTKRGDRLWKERSALAEPELVNLVNPMSLETWPGHWFHQRLMSQQLRPACLVSYLRTALVGECAEGPLRLTIDHDIRGVLAKEWLLAPLQDGRPLLTPGTAVMELKFLDALPRPFKELVAHFRMSPTAASKYRACCEAWGLNAGPGIQASSRTFAAVGDEAMKSAQSA